MPQPRRRRKRRAGITIFDVAQKAGVGISTVSLALRGNPRVAARTRAAVLKAAEFLHYQPNVAAQSLARRQTNLIAVCGYFYAESLDYNSYGSSQMLAGVLNRLKGTRYAIYVVNWSTHPQEHHRLLTDISKQGFICGSIWLTSILDLQDKKLARHSPTPVVLTEAQLPDLDSVTVDGAMGGHLGAEHLLKGDARSLVLVTGDPVQMVQKDRLRGVQRAMAHLGQSWAAVTHFRADHYSFSDGLNVAAGLLRLLQKGPESARYAVFCLAGDWCALGILQGLKNAGVKVPEKVSVLGYDGMLPSAFVYPPLSTVQQPFCDVGYAAAGALLERIENPKMPVKQLRLQPRLIVRDSA